MPNRKIKHIIAKLVGASTEETLDVYDVDAVHTDKIYNALDQTAAGYVLDARQGKALNDSLNNIALFNFSWTPNGANTTQLLDVNISSLGLTDVSEIVSMNVYVGTINAIGVANAISKSIIRVFIHQVIAIGASSLTGSLRIRTF